MSTVTEIEAAIAKLPDQQRDELLERLSEQAFQKASSVRLFQMYDEEEAAAGDEGSQWLGDDEEGERAAS